MTPDEIYPRPLTAREAETLRFMLSSADPRLVRLREQSEVAMVTGKCACGCAAIYLRVDRGKASPASGLCRAAINAQTPNFVDAAGRTYEIKTRRVYESGRRISETRRINGLVGKTADVLVVVRLDRALRCGGMWTMAVRDVINPKSANMTSILRTPGITRVR